MKLRLKNPRIISAIGFLILIALVWFIGPFFAISEEDRLKLIFGIMALWVLTLLIGQLLAIRAGRLLEKMLRRQADDAVVGASAGRRAEVKILRERMLEAIQTLKTSKLGKLSGQAALYELPWYMIIGHPAAGKSTALLQSGLTFPFSDQHGAAVRGMGGTMNCDWFFSSEGVLLDTAGRYTTETEDRAEWMGFLGLLKRYRAQAPVNGLLVATSLPELLQYRSESFTVYARQIRERIHEIEDVFGLRPPVYLIFTKLDLLGGFAQFFSDASDEERSRVWGATLGHEQGPDFDARRAVDEQCELLFRGLRQIGEDKLGLARGAGVRPALFAFPLEFHAIKEGVCRFVELLCEDDPYHVKPLLRGFYFTSAVQEGEPCIAAAMRVSSQFELSRSGFGAGQPTAAYGYFLRDLFKEVLFADQHLITLQSRPQTNRMRMTSMAAGLVALAGATGLLTLSYTGNLDMLATAGSDYIRVMNAQTLPDKLSALAGLQKRIEELQQYHNNGVPWKMGIGLYQGRKLEKALRTQYFEELRVVMLNPVRAELETALKRWTQTPVQPGGPNPEADRAYDALKTYLMLATKPRLDARYLEKHLPGRWNVWLQTQNITMGKGAAGEDAVRAVKFYLSQIAAPDLPLIENDPALIEPSRKALLGSLAQLPAKDRIYAELKAQANARFPSTSVSRILQGRDADVFVGTVEVPGAFSRKAWNDYMKEAIVRASQGEISSEDWVLATTNADLSRQQGSDRKQNQEELETLYRTEYAKAWMEFLRGLDIPGWRDIKQAETALARLSNPQDSPLRFVLQRVVWETSWDNPPPMSTAVSGARDGMNTWLTRQTGSNRQVTVPPVNLDGYQYGKLGRQFASLAKLVGTDKVETGGMPLSEEMKTYQDRLGKLKTRFNKIAAAADDSSDGEAYDLMENTLEGNGSEIADAMQYVEDALFTSSEAPFRDALTPLLTRPMLRSYATLVPRAEEVINVMWENDVYDAWRELAGKYPFSNTRDEAEFAEISNFVKPDGVLDKYINEILGELVVRRGNQISPRLWHGMGVRLNTGFLANLERLLSFSKTLRGSEMARFELQPVPTPGLSEIRVEIDGQTLRYRNGPQPWQAFKWPTADQGSRIQAVAFDGTSKTVAEYSGRMGLIRMLGQSARTYDPRTTRGQLTWNIEGLGDAKEVKLNFNMVSGLNPLQFAALRSVTLPKRITQ